VSYSDFIGVIGGSGKDTNSANQRGCFRSGPIATGCVILTTSCPALALIEKTQPPGRIGNVDRRLDRHAGAIAKPHWRSWPGHHGHERQRLLNRRVGCAALRSGQALNLCWASALPAALKGFRRPISRRRRRSALRAGVSALVHWSQAGRRPARSLPPVPSPQSSVRSRGLGRVKRY
jgi:hypothetical protein